jgi:hypothetical protein
MLRNRRNKKIFIIGTALMAWLIFFLSSGYEVSAASYGYGGGGGGGSNAPVLSSAKAITAFLISGQVGVTIIDNDKKIISLTMPYGTDLSTLIPSIAITGISVSPVMGAANDFTVSRTYTVKAENGSAQDYLVIVSLFSPSASTAATSTSGNINGGGNYVDIIKDSNVDILDFNAMMVDWGNKGKNQRADISGDGIVDVFDFNLLMVYWGKPWIYYQSQ